MEKEKILRQLEEKLLPSVQNLEKGQATDHDYLPALLWMLLEKSKDSENSLKDIGLKHSQELGKSTNAIIQNTQENRKIYGEQLSKAVNFISGKNQESSAKIEQAANEQFKKIINATLDNHKISQEKINELENKILIISQKIEEIKTEQSKKDKKLFIWFLSFSVFQIISLIILAIILMK